MFYLTQLKLVAMFALLNAFGAEQKPVQQFDLKGETIGESLDAFRKAHPGARCWKNDPALVVQMGEDSCAVHRGISFAGLPALVDEDCDQIEARVGDEHNCSQGLSALFRSGKLIQLTYTLDAMGGLDSALNQIYSALTEKFGKPNIPNRATWSNGKEVLSYRNSAVIAAYGKVNYNVVTIMLFVIENNSKKDI